MSNHLSLILLAAGKSSRMGDANKLLLPINNDPILKTVLSQISKISIDQKIIVTGFQAEKIKPLIDKSIFEIIHNPNFEEGMTSSIQAGISALSKNSIGVMIIPADLPNLDSKILTKLVDVFLENYLKNAKTIVASTENGVQKNPVIFSSYYYSEILAHKNKNGCKEIIESHLKNVTSVEISSKDFFQDIDTPADYKKIVDETTERNS